MRSVASRRKPTSDALHRRLAAWNVTRLTPRVNVADVGREFRSEIALRRTEHEFVEAERASVRDAAAGAPTRADSFLRWYEELKQVGPGQNDSLFPWLARDATREQMRWFLRQEMAGEAGFDDLVALTQVKLPVRAKLELARNYWDEMGRGRERAMHGPLLGNLARELEIDGDVTRVVWEANALANLLVALAANRRYAYHAIGALGAIEMTAPGRVADVDAGPRASASRRVRAG